MNPKSNSSISPEQFLKLARALPEPTCLVSGDGMLLAANPPVAEMLGQRAEELHGKRLADFVSDSEERVREYLRACSRSREMVLGSLCLRAGDGNNLWCRCEGAVVHPRTDDAPALILLRFQQKESAASRFLLLNQKIDELAKEIRERRRAEEEAQEQRERLRVTLESIGDAVIATDASGVVTFMNPVAQGLTGWTDVEAAGVPLHEVFRIVNEYSRKEVENPITKVLRDGVIVGLANHTVLIARDGTERPIDDSGAPIRNENGKIIGVVLVFRDIAERRRTEEAIRQSEERFAKAFAASPLALTITSLKTGHLLEVNETFTRLSGYTREEAVGHTTVELNLWARTSDREAEIATVMQAGQVRDAEYRFRMKDGTERIGLLSAERIEIGGEPCALTVIQDITEQKHAEAERDRMLEREKSLRASAETATRLKDEFLAVVSHELRTPLTAIMGWTHMLETLPLDHETAQHAIHVIKRNAEQQKQIVQDILDVSRIITGKLQLESERIEMMPLMQAAIDSVRPAAEAKGIRLRQQFDSSATVTGDPRRLQQIIWNLLSNAVKFTPARGDVSVSVERLLTHVRIEVSDTGQGISSDFLPYVFDRFSQADSSSTRLHGGLGLGLAIVRHLVEMHGGSVHAYSAGEGEGATFTVDLPLPIEPEQSAAPVSVDEASAPHEEMSDAFAHPIIGGSDEAPPPLTGLRALLVDDDGDTLEMLTMLLRRNGAEVSTASSVEAALEALEQAIPDVIVADIGMPQLDGYELLRRVRSLDEQRGGKIPAIALTAYAGESDRVRALRSGFQEHLAKPVMPDLLIATILKFAEPHALRKS